MSSPFNPVGVIGSGSFGTAVANLLAYNADVLLFSRKQETVDAINHTRKHLGVQIAQRVTATNDLEELARRCTLIMPVIPSNSFRKVMRAIAPFLRPHHINTPATKANATPCHKECSSVQLRA